MGDLFGDRGKGLEEEYFHRKNKEAIEKIRSKIKVAEAAKSSGQSTMECPRCNGKLQTTMFEKLEVNVCGTCAGVWLDSGELQQLMGHEQGGWFNSLWRRFHHD